MDDCLIDIHKAFETCSVDQVANLQGRVYGLKFVGEMISVYSSEENQEIRAYEEFIEEYNDDTRNA